MEMRDASPGRRAEIEADVESVGVDRRTEHLLSDHDDFHHVRTFRGLQVPWVRHRAERDRQEMAGIIGKAVEHQIRETGAMENEGGAIVPLGREFGEEPAVVRRFRRFDIGHPPIGMKLLHCSSQAH